MRFLDYIEVNPTIKFEKGKVYPFVEMANVDIYAREPKTVEIKKYSAGVKFQKGDTVVSRIEPCLQNGKGFYAKNINEGFGSTEFLVFRPKYENIDNDYLYYLLLTDHIRKSMIGSMTGATGRQRVNNDVFNSLELSLPDIEIQKRIAGILSAYDDLIENNHKQIKLLEEAAMRLYKEWFVNLHFPGYKTTKIVNGLPEGWTLAKTKDFLKFKYGKGLKADNRKLGGYPVYGSSGIVGYHNVYLVEGPVIIVGRKGNVGSVYLSYKNAYPIDTVYYIESDISTLYAFFDLLTRTFNNNDSAVPGLNRDYAESMAMMCPNSELMDKFDEQASILLGLQNKLLSQIDLLQQARDKLIDKLMSGEIEV